MRGYNVRIHGDDDAEGYEELDDIERQQVRIAEACRVAAYMPGIQLWPI